MSLELSQLREYVVKPVLNELQMYSLAAEQLVLGTICQESGGRYLKQLDHGPAVGICQMEPATHKDIWLNYLTYQGTVAKDVASFLSARSEEVQAVTGYPDHKELISNLAYAVAMCRVHYRRQPQALPQANDIKGLAAYWKQLYNTPLGAGTVAEFIKHFPYSVYGLER